MFNVHPKSFLARIFGHHTTLSVYEKDGKFGVGTSAAMVPAYTFATKAEAEEYIQQHGKEVQEENGDEEK